MMTAEKAAPRSEPEWCIRQADLQYAAKAEAGVAAMGRVVGFGSRSRVKPPSSVQHAPLDLRTSVGQRQSASELQRRNVDSLVANPSAVAAPGVHCMQHALDLNHEQVHSRDSEAA